MNIKNGFFFFGTSYFFIFDKGGGGGVKLEKNWNMDLYSKQLIKLKWNNAYLGVYLFLVTLQTITMQGVSWGFLLLFPTQPTLGME